MEFVNAAALNRSPKFKVRRKEAVLVPPAKPTPREFKRLSDLDNEESLRLLMPAMMFYPYTPKMAGKDPANIMKEALSKALVYFYPLAGRVREFPDSNPKLVLDCTAEGVLFIEAEADVTLDQLGHILYPPYSYLDEVMYDVPGMGGILDSPVIQVQITRLKCGGLILASRYNTTIMDATGYAVFSFALCELAQGASKPSVLPVWDRDRLFARIPSRVTCVHPEFEDATEHVQIQDKAYRLFYFTDKELGILKKLVPPHLQKSSSFDLITGFLWRCRTMALQLHPEEEVRIIFAVNARDKYNPPLPKGFYGNAFAFAASLTTAGEVCKSSLGYAVELVVNAKNKVTEEYMRSFIDGLAIRGWPRIPMLLSSFFTSDLRKMGYLKLDFGWGEPISAGPGIAYYEPYPQGETNYVLCRNAKTGETVTVIPICLPATVMELFEQEIYSTLKIRGFDPSNLNQQQPISNSSTATNNVIKSYL